MKLCFVTVASKPTISLKMEEDGGKVRKGIISLMDTFSALAARHSGDQTYDDSFELISSPLPL